MKRKVFKLKGEALDNTITLYLVWKGKKYSCGAIINEKNYLKELNILNDRLTNTFKEITKNAKI